MQGQLEGLSLPETFRRILAEKMTGKLRIAAGPLEKCIFFRNGQIVFATSNHPQERLGEILFKEGKINAHDKDTASNFPMPGKKFGDTLVEMGKLTEAELKKMVYKQVMLISSSVFLMQEGSYAFSEDARSPQEIGITGVSTHDIVLNGIREMPFKDEMRQKLGPSTRPLKLTADAYRIAEIVTLKPNEGFVVSRIDGVATLNEISPLVPAEEFDTYRLLYGLHVLGLLVENPERHTSADAVRESGAKPPGTTRGPSREHAAGDPEQGGDRDVRTIFSQLDHLDLYQLLGVPNNASTPAIKKTYYRMAKIYHPDRFQSEGDKALQKKAERVFAKMTEAYEVLVDAQARMSYDHRGSGEYRKVDERREEKMAEKDAKGAADQASAQENYKKGTELYKSRKYAEAIEPLSQAAKMNPRNLEFQLALGWAQAKNPPTRKEAEKTFLRAVNLDKLNAEPYVAMGKFYKEIKDFVKAEALLTRALALNDEHEEAQKELASLPGRQEEKKSFWSRLTGR
ncbi:MAG: DnaJ domain-containing protein [Acidobacteria bacterium]|nr:DnaJ domain-containing protein [Acidobacteriota bacterium]